MIENVDLKETYYSCQEYRIRCILPDSLLIGYDIKLVTPPFWRSIIQQRVSVVR